MIWLYILCAALALAVIILALRLALVRRAATEIRLGMAEKLASDTNTLIVLSTRDKAMRDLARDLNRQLKQLRLLRHRYVQGDAELKNAITGISHDLRTPLTAISAYLELLEREEKSETVSGYTAIIRNRTDELIRLTEELFSYSVITSPQRAAKPEPTDVKALLEESLLGFYAALEERRIRPYLRLAEPRVMRNVDRADLSRVFSNLLNNAVKYSGGDLDIELTAEGRITFANTAPGLSDVQVERLFDRFYTVESAGRSTGLGLAIARTLIERMGGKISAEYVRGRLRVCVFLPEKAE